MSAPAHTYIGVWTDWSYGRIRGSTITLSETNSGLLIAFIALLVSAAGSAFWQIFSFVAHRLRARSEPQDGLYHQQQNLLRNCESPNGTLGELLSLFRAWRRNADRAFLRSLPLGLAAALSFALFALAGIFSSSAIKAAGSNTLTRSSSCGTWESSTGAETDSSGQVAANNELNSTLRAASYASACYTSTPDPLQCSIYAISKLPFKTNANASCPFASGMCFFSDRAAYQMDTGKLDSNFHLGINSRPEDRITYQRITTCAPILINNYVTIQEVTGVNGTKNLIENVYLGPTITRSETYSYNNDSGNYVDGYTINAAHNYAGSDIMGPWAPISALIRMDADITIYFLSANSIQYVGPVDDPWFAAHVSTVVNDDYSYGFTDTLYSADLLVNALGCIDQHQICNPTNKKCTSLSGSIAVEMEVDNGNIGLNVFQNSTFDRLMQAVSLSDMYYAIYRRGNTALQAQTSESENSQLVLPNNQWQLEVTSWFTTGLARLQQKIVDYAAGPPGPLTNGAYIQAGDPDMCANQKVRSGSDTASFSVLSTSIIIAICVLLIIISLSLDKISSYIQNRWNRGGSRHKQWLLDGKFQLQRLVFEGAGMGNWINVEEEIPVTVCGQRFGISREDDENHPTATEKNEIVREK